MKYDIGAMIDLEEKAVSESEDCYHFQGYAAIFNTVDRGKDAIVPGAFAKSLREIGLPQLLYQHEMKEVVGALTDAKEDKRGLFVKGDLPKDDDFVRGRLVPQLKRKGIRGMSIGYTAREVERRKSDGVRLLKQVDCWECSFVTIPMHPDAGVTHIKGFVPFQGLPVESKSVADPKAAADGWNAEAAFARIKARFGDSDEDVKRAFLFAGDNLDTKLLIADVDEKGNLVANRVALYKAAASVSKGATIPEEAQEAVQEHLDRYYAQIGLESPFKSISVPEWKSLDVGEREARLKGLGLANDLARALAPMQLGQREADRKSSDRDGRSPEEQALLQAAGAFAELFSAIKSTRR